MRVVYITYSRGQMYGGRMQDIFGLAIHTTPIGHRVSELGDNSVSVHQRWNMCPFNSPLLHHSSLKFGSPIFQGDLRLGFSA